MKQETNNTERAKRFVDRSPHTKKLNDHARRSLVRGITALMRAGKNTCVAECYSNVSPGKIIEANADMRGVAIIAGCHENIRKECDRDKSCTLFGIENPIAEYKKCRKIRLTISEI